MMLETIQNNELCVRIACLGGELQSITDSDGTEFLWQGDPAYWSNRALNIFPLIGRTTGGRYVVNGREYNIGIHGFLKDSDMTKVTQTEDSLVFELRSNAETLRQFPFPFILRIKYTLKGTKLDVLYQVKNTGDKTMYFGIGGHPGFNVPLESSLKFTDYYLEFDDACQPIRVGMSDDCFVTGNDCEFLLDDARRLSLNHSLFDNDAIILKRMTHKVRLVSNMGKKAVSVEYPDMPFLGVWQRPKMDAPYVCIEPWTSLPSHKDVVEDIAVQQDLISLMPESDYNNAWRIELTV